MFLKPNPRQKGDAKGPVREGLRPVGRDHDCKCSAGTLGYLGSVAQQARARADSLGHLCCASLHLVFICESGL